MISLICIPTRHHTVPTKTTNVRVQYVNIKYIYINIANRGSKVTAVIEDHNLFL